MTFRLALGAMLTERRSILFLLAMVAFNSRLGSTSAWVMSGAVTILACSVGPSATNAFSTRTFSVLPLDARDINRATWVLVVCLPLLLLTVGRVASASTFAPFGDEWSWVFPATPVRVFYECLFFAMVGAWNVLVPDTPAPDWGSSGLGLFVLALLGTMAVPFVVLLYLPATFAGVSPFGWLLTGVAIALASTPLFLAPKPFVRNQPPPPVLETAPARLVPPKPFVRNQPPPPVLETAPARLAPGAAVAGLLPAPRITGVWALMPQVMAHAAAWAGVLIIVHLALQFTRTSQPLLQPFTADMSGVRFLQVGVFMMLFFIGLLPGLGQNVPMLKLLPVSARRAAMVMTLAPVMTPLVYWAALILMHVAVSTAWPETLRPEYLLCLAGLAAVVDALGIKSGSQGGKAAIGFPIVFVLAFALDGDRTGLEQVLRHWLVPAAGIALLTLAYALNLHTMTRSERASRAYRYGRTGVPLGAR